MTNLSAGRALVLHSLLVAGMAVAVAGWHLPPILLLLTGVPVVFSPLRYPRPVYLSLALISTAAVAAVLPFVPVGTNRPWVSFAVTVPVFVVMADALGRWVVRSRRAEKALRESEELRRSIVESSPDHIMLLDGDDRIVFINRTVPDLTVEGVLGTSVYDHVPASEHETMRQCFARVRSSRQQDRYDVEYVTQEGESRSFESYASPVLEGGEVVAITVASRDVTERLELEQERQQLEKQLLQSQKMEALGRLAGGVAHDFNNLLTAILGNSELLLESLPCEDGSPADVAAADKLEEIRLAAERAGLLTRQLLAFGRRQVTRPEILDPRTVLERLQPLLRRLIEESIRLRYRLPEEALTICMDPGQLEQVVLNLVLNARDAMPEGGAITVSCSEESVPESAELLPPRPAPGRYFVLSVHDEGAGIDPAVRENIFEPFVTTKSEGRGSGLGLATVYAATVQARGHVDVSCRQEEGTTFRVYLPISDQPAAAPRRVEETAGGAELILVCEDDAAVRRVTCLMLESGGYRVLPAASAREALYQLDTGTESIQLLVTDVVMPEMRGTELARRMRERNPELPVLFVSGYSAELVDDDGFRRDGNIETLTKPFAPKELLARVRRILDASGSTRPA